MQPLTFLTLKSSSLQRNSSRNVSNYKVSMLDNYNRLLIHLQADLCGIKWKKLVLNERPLATGDPLDDPVLRSYTKCLAKDILCVWRRVSQHKNDLDQTGGLGMFDISQIGCTSVIHPPLSLTAAKELWIFWYGEEPDLTDSVSPELLKSPGKSHKGFASQHRGNLLRQQTNKKKNLKFIYFLRSLF